MVDSAPDIMPPARALRICIVCGKRPRAGRLTKDFRQRIRHLVQVLAHKGLDYFSLVIFTGGDTAGQGRSEARLGLDEFKRQLGLRFPPAFVEQRALESGERLVANPRLHVAIPVFLDERSTNTRENVAAVRDHLARRFAGKRSLEVVVLSTSYHIDRLRTVHTHLRPRSLLKCIEELACVERVCLESSPYFFEPPQSQPGPAVAWRAKVYQLVDRMTVMRVNLEGIQGGELDDIKRPVVDLFAETLAEFKSCLTSPDTPADESTRQALEDYVAGLEACYGRLDGVAGRPLTREERGSILFALHHLGETLDRLAELTDPDEPVEDDDAGTGGETVIEPTVEEERAVRSDATEQHASPILGPVLTREAAKP